MVQRTIARWLIEYDRGATQQCYAEVPTGTGCECIQCRNFDSALKKAFPAEFCAIADELGLDLAKPAELCHWCREPSGLYLTGGWYHFVGSILAGEDVMQLSDGIGRFRFEALVPGFEFGLGTHCVLARDAFGACPLVQLDFQTRVPWVLKEAEPTDA
jgi:hypothetical protein